MKTIKINHIGYTVLVKTMKDFKKTPEYNPILKAVVVRDSCHQSTIYIKDTKAINISSVAHEVLHVLQFISEDRFIDMTKEKEHFAYMMSYIMNKILGYEYETN